MHVLLAQAFMATGGVEDVGLELGANGLIASEGHGDSEEALGSVIAPSRGILEVKGKFMITVNQT